jgi:hypothetical protein
MALVMAATDFWGASDLITGRYHGPNTMLAQTFVGTSFGRFADTGDLADADAAIWLDSRGLPAYANGIALGDLRFFGCAFSAGANAPTDDTKVPHAFFKLNGVGTVNNLVVQGCRGEVGVKSVYRLTPGASGALYGFVSQFNDWSGGCERLLCGEALYAIRGATVRDSLTGNPAYDWGYAVDGVTPDVDPNSPTYAARRRPLIDAYDLRETWVHLTSRTEVQHGHFVAGDSEGTAANRQIDSCSPDECYTPWSDVRIRFNSEKNTFIPQYRTDILTAVGGGATTPIEVFPPNEQVTLGSSPAFTTNVSTTGNLTATGDVSVGDELFIGADTKWYRSAANAIRTPDALTVDGTLSGGTTITSGTGLVSTTTTTVGTTLQVSGESFTLGGAAGAVGACQEIVARKNCLSSTATDVFSITVPAADHGATLFFELAAFQGGSNAGEGTAWLSADMQIARDGTNNAAFNGPTTRDYGSVDNGDQIDAWSLTAALTTSGTGTNTITVRATITTAGATAAVAVVHARLLNNSANGITIGVASP